MRTYVGRCSRVIAPGVRRWRSSLGYLSDKFDCRIYDGDSDLAGAAHSLRLPAAVKYGSVRVDTYDSASRGSSVLDAAVLAYRTRSGQVSDSATAILRPGVGTHRGPTVGPAFVTSTGRLSWFVSTVFGASYDVKRFTVHYSYYVLR